MLSCILSFADLPTPKRQKMWEPAEPRTGKSSEEWVKSSDMSQGQVEGLLAGIMGIGSHVTLTLEL